MAVAHPVSRFIPPIPDDTDADAHAVQVALLRGFSTTRRAQVALSLTSTVVGAARRALMQAYPDATKEEIDVLFVETHYGRELADGLRDDLARRRAAVTASSTS
jgi:hypothetical protein